MNLKDPYAAQRKWQKVHKEQYNEYMREYKKKNKDKINKLRREKRKLNKKGK